MGTKPCIVTFNTQLLINYKMLDIFFINKKIDSKYFNTESLRFHGNIIPYYRSY